MVDEGEFSIFSQHFSFSQKPYTNLIVFVTVLSNSLKGTKSYYYETHCQLPEITISLLPKSVIKKKKTNRLDFETKLIQHSN